MAIYTHMGSNMRQPQFKTWLQTWKSSCKSSWGRLIGCEGEWKDVLYGTFKSGFKICVIAQTFGKCTSTILFFEIGEAIEVHRIPSKPPLLQGTVISKKVRQKGHGASWPFWHPFLSSIKSATKKRHQKVVEAILVIERSPRRKGRQKVVALAFTFSTHTK